VAVEANGLAESAEPLDQRADGGRRRYTDRVGEHQFVRLQLAGERKHRAGVDLALERGNRRRR
jgi:hypothetical protein